MTVHSLTAAKKVCELRDWSVTNLEINKILYVAHMVSLGRSGGSVPLVSENFQAWDYGPVLPNVYCKAKIFGNSPVQNIFQLYPDLANGDDARVLEETVNMLKNKSAGQLVAITHWEKGAWASHYVPGAKGVVIPNQDIFDEYRNRV